MQKWKNRGPEKSVRTFTYFFFWLNDPFPYYWFIFLRTEINQHLGKCVNECLEMKHNILMGVTAACSINLCKLWNILDLNTCSVFNILKHLNIFGLIFIVKTGIKQELLFYPNIFESRLSLWPASFVDSFKFFSELFIEGYLLLHKHFV